MTADQRHPRSSSQRTRPMLAAVALLVAFGAGAETGTADANARYQAEKNACLSGQSHQDQATCLKEATAALGQSGSNRPENEANNYNRNSLLRCNALPTDERSACERRIDGEGSTSGSVEGGGVLREIVTPDQK